MNKVLYISLLICVSASSLFAQIKEQYFDEDIFYSQLNPKMKLYKIISYTDTSDQTVKKINIYDSQNRLIQTIDLSDYELEPPNNPKYLQFIDLNCDGYKDIKLQQWWGATGNEGFLVWIYNPNKNQFIINDEMSRLPGIDADCIKGTISSWYRESASDNRGATYKITKKGLVIISNYENYWDREKDKIITIRRENKNGKMVEISRKEEITK